MLITVKYLTAFSILTGRREEKVRLREGARLKDLLGLLHQKYGEEIKKHVENAMILVNGKSAGLEDPLGHGDVVAISHPVGGGGLV
ncbi:MAG: MoaD family protein [Candidatus Nezhaarchaeota archaeon]|nr:MoaD family protein [Candidatus Nezhaarchaeota archaeon]